MDVAERLGAEIRRFVGNTGFWREPHCRVASGDIVDFPYADDVRFCRRYVT